MNEREKAAVNEGMEKITGESPSLAMELVEKLNESSKREAATSERTIKRLWIALIIFAIVIIAQFCLNTYERMQYDYVSSYQATGAYAVIDSDGTVIGGDYTADEIQKMLEAALEFAKTQDAS